MWLRSKEEEVRARHDEALERLESGDLEGARRLAEELKTMRWSGAYEVLALAARAENDLEGAVRILDEGCALAPQAWALHELRGSLLDAIGRGSDALAAYEAALGCEGAWAASIRYNRSITRLKNGDPGGALADAEAVLSGATPPPFALDAIGVAIDALDALGRRDDAISLVRTALAEAAEGEVRSRLHALLADALGRAGRTDEARALAEKTIDEGFATAKLVGLLAPIPHEERAPSVLRVVVEGVLTLADGAHPFYRALTIVAADADEALAWARQAEPTRDRDALRVHECTRTDARPEGRGIVHVSGRVFYRD